MSLWDVIRTASALLADAATGVYVHELVRVCLFVLCVCACVYECLRVRVCKARAIYLLSRFLLWFLFVSFSYAQTI